MVFPYLKGLSISLVYIMCVIVSGISYCSRVLHICRSRSLQHAYIHSF
jgi:hypothetical protein